MFLLAVLERKLREGDAKVCKSQTKIAIGNYNFAQNNKTTTTFQFCPSSFILFVLIPQTNRAKIGANQKNIYEEITSFNMCRHRKKFASLINDANENKNCRLLLIVRFFYFHFFFVFCAIFFTFIREMSWYSIWHQSIVFSFFFYVQSKYANIFKTKQLNANKIDSALTD